MVYNKETKKSIEFYIAANNHDLLRSVDRIMAGKGLMSFKDQSGKYHYLVDGRRGAPYAAENIDQMAKIILDNKGRNLEEEELNAEFYVDSVLSCYLFDQSLKGYRYIRYILIQITLNPSLNHSLSKNIYPLCAKAFSVNSAQVERNIRYCLERLKYEEEHDFLPHIMPLVFREGRPIHQSVKRRVLIKDRKRYSNAESIRVLEHEVQQLIRRDKRSD